ncbi:hypothetical protein EPN44_16080 [bacterium]|nr:MAG: hypothetical protein EPN44_16080 [bacterium]
MQADLFASDAITLDTVLGALRGRMGAANGCTARELVLAISGRFSTADERRLRKVIEALRGAGHPVCGTPDTGYFLAANAAELDRTCEFLFRRSMTSLRQVSAMRRVTLPDLRGQLGLPIGASHESHE